MTPPKSVGHEIALYGVITADLVESRRLIDRGSAQQRLSSLVRTLNSRFARTLAAEFMITLGDEIQGMFSQVHAVPDGVVCIHEEFHPREIRVGIGIGHITTQLSEKVTGMDGPAFVNARDAVDVAKKRAIEVVVRTGDDRADAVLNAIYLLLEGIKVRWTEPQWNRVNLYRELDTIERVARKLGVAKQSISKSLRNTLWLRVLEVEATLPQVFSSVMLLEKVGEPQPSNPAKRLHSSPRG